MVPRDGFDADLHALRRRAFAVAYRMLGSVAEAEDVAQEALLRLSRLAPPPDEPVAWTTTVSTRLAIDHLRLARVRRETYAGSWLPEPVVADPRLPPDLQAEASEGASLAFLLLLERLTPPQRAAFVLREAFGCDYAHVARTLGTSEAACRQLVSRARRIVQEEGSDRAGDPEHGARLLEAFLAAAEDGDLTRLEGMLARDAVLWGDGGGQAEAVREPVHGRAAVARFLVDVARRRRVLGTFDLQVVRVNGRPGRVLRDGRGRVWDVLAIEPVDGLVRAVHVQRNPEKLDHLPQPVTRSAADPSEPP